MDNYGYTNQCLTRNGAPWMPTMGEFHYSRYPHRHWRRELAKMKAGGIDIVASYVIWIHHEEEEGRISFADDLNIRGFVEAAGELGMLVFLRIGPWVHAEVRNGGFSDWIVSRPYIPRSNDPAYLEDVRRFYSAIYGQVEGLFHRDGGPIVGIQIENEYAHAGGGLKGEEGERHMRGLTAMAKKIGYDAPYWTATGWGGAMTGGLLPVMGGYAEAPWDQRMSEIEPSDNFVFTARRNDSAIASDYGKGSDLTFNPAEFPFLTAELGAGLQATYHRRPVASGKDVEAMSLCKLGSGTSLLGYYLFHGGTNPVGLRSTFQESRESGYPNDLPVYSVDYNAPLGEFGQMRDSFRRLRRQGLFLREFGNELAAMEVNSPLGNPENPSNFDALRHTQRDNGTGGYILVNNYQRRHGMADHKERALTAAVGSGEIAFPPRDINDGQYFYWPFRLQIGDALLESATASPLCTLQTAEGIIPVFFGNFDPAYNWITPPKNGRVLTLSEEDSLLAAKINGPAGEHLLLWDGVCYEDGSGALLLEGPGSGELRVWPPLPAAPEGFCKLGERDGFAIYALPERGSSAEVAFACVARSEKESRWRLDFTYSGEMAGALLQIEGIYDVGKLYVNGDFVQDFFYNGEPWMLDMERFGYPESAEVVLTPLRIDQPIFLDRWPELPEGKGCELLSAQIDPVTIHALKLR
ncbi:MAG: beta-galactosidase [Oscillospiraceae bacterium]